MRIIGVLDLARGQAVHARGGRRDRYQPVERVAGRSVLPGDALSVAREFVGRLGVVELYVADLDAIQGGRMQDTVVTALARLGAPIWLDAGVTSPGAARQARGLGARHVVVGLETLSSFDALGRICDDVGPESIAFSLDLRLGRPIVAEHASHGHESPEDMCSRAAAAGVRHIIVLDLARVGSNAGLDVALLGRIRGTVPGVVLLAGGGVRDAGDVEELAAAGCDGALVASALLSGAIGAARGNSPG